jgi:hypothetical protein
MAIRNNNISSRKIYIGTNTEIVPNDGDALISGNVGIGTTSPSTKLDVQGAVTIKGTGTGTSGSLAIQDDYSGANHLANIGWIRSSGGVYLSYGLKQENSTEWKSTYANFSGERTYAKLDNNEFSMAYAPAQNTAVGTAVTGLTEKFKFYLNTGVLRLNSYSAGILTTDSSGTVGLAGSGDLPGGPYLPLSAGSGEILTGDLAMNNNIGIITKDSSGVFKDILKLNSSNVLEIGSSALNTNTIFRNTGNVGIGTTSPNHKLDVLGGSGNDVIAKFKTTGTGTGDYSEIHIANNNEDRLVIGSIGSNYTNSSWAGMRYVYATAGDLGLKATASNGNVRIYTGGAGNERMRITSTGNVGIGTTSPASKLQVGDYMASNVLTIGGWYGGGGGTLAFKSGYVPNPAYVWDTARIKATDDGNFNGRIEFQTTASGGNSGASPTTKMVLKASGRVGIGTTDPSSKLEVTGDTYVTNEFSQGVSNSNKIYNYGSEFRTNGASIQIVFGRDGNAIGSGAIGADATNCFAVWNTDDTLKRMVISQSGSVGIGTDSPTEKLEVKGNVILDAASTRLKLKGGVTGTNSGIDWTFNTDSTQYARIELDYDTRASTGLLIDSGYPMTLDYSSGSFSVKKNGSSELTILNGNVGIGTTSPAGRLELNGSGQSWSTAPGIRMWDSFNSKGWFVGSANNIDAGDFYIRTLPGEDTNPGSSQQEFTIKHASGNVGIGTTSPSAKLEVNGQTVINSTGLTEGFQWFNDTNEIFSLEDTSGAGELLLLSSNSVKVKLNANGNSYFNGGNVGINNTSPVNGKLVVTSTEEDLLNTVRIQHTRSNSNFGSKALEIDMNLSGADTTTADRTNRGIYVDLDSSADGDAANEHRIRGIESDVRFTGFSDIVRAGQFYAESNNITEKTAQLVGVYGQAVHDAGNAAGGVSNMIGAYGYSSIQDLGDVDNAFGVYGLVDIGDNRGNADVGVTKAVEGEISINKSTALNYGTMIGISSIIDNNEGSVPNFGDQYLFKGDYQGTKGSNAYGIYTEGDKHYFDGKVGIGNTSPDEKLEVSGSGASDYPSIKISNPGQTGRYMRIGMIDSINHCIEANGGSTYLTFKTNATERMRIATDGKVGIGTTSPGSKLEVKNSTAATYTPSLYNSNSTLSLKSPNSIDNYSSIRFTNNAGNYEKFIGSVQTGTNTADIVFQGFDRGGGGYKEYARIAENGNVGIGTNSPSEKLSVAGNAVLGEGMNRSVRYDSGGGNFRITPNNGGWATGYFFNNQSEGFLGGFGALGGSNDSFSYFWIGDDYNDTTMVIKPNAGNVGIGTTTPLAKLAVIGDVHVGDIYTPSDKSLKLRTQGGLFEITTYNTATAGTAIKYSWGTGGQGPLTINNAVGEVMRLDGGGNVGIGTASPVAPLHIAKATTTATDPLLKLERISPVVDYQDLNSSGYFYLKENFKNSSSTVIGSREVWQNPGGSGLYYNFDNGGSGGSQHRQKQNSFHWTINSNSEKLTLGTNGYLGVNDTSPSYQLDVNGSGRFTSTVTATNFILSSDERLKENIEKVCDNRVKADWKTFELKADKGQRRYGVIAQELEKTNPEFVREDVDGFKSVAYIDLLIAKIAELEARLEKLEK